MGHEQDTLFVIWAYIGVAIGVAGLIGWTLFDARSTARKLAALESRRSAA